MTPFTIYTANKTGAKQNTMYPNEVSVDNLTALEQAMRRDHVCAKYKGNERSIANFRYSDCIPMDCDNDHSDNPEDWMGPEDVQKAFPGVAFAVSFSRNHMKEKGGKAARPKFHCYFPIGRISSAEQYTALKRQIQKVFPQFDANALDAGRFLFDVENPQVMYFKGKKTVDKLFILAGGRNGTLHKKACQLIKRYGEVEAKAHFDAEAAKCVPPLKQQELDAIWSSACKFGERIAAAEGYIPPEQFAAAQDFLKQLKPEDNPVYPWTELGAGRLFATYYKNITRYVTERKSWHIYEAGVWKKDIGALRTMELCKDLAMEIMRYSLTIEDERKRAEYMKFCQRWQNHRMRVTILDEATLNARLLYENSFDYKPQFKMYINTNYRPVINDLTLFSSNRVVVIPFNRHFDENEQDKNLKTQFKLPENQSAILNWLIEGYHLIIKEGLQPPKAVQEAVEEYRKDSDKIARFTEECLEAIEGAEVRTQLVYDRYKEWCEDNGCRPESMVKFKQALDVFATVERKRPAGGGSKTTLLLGYRLSGTASPL